MFTNLMRYCKTSGCYNVVLFFTIALIVGCQETTILPSASEMSATETGATNEMSFKATELDQTDIASIDQIHSAIFLHDDDIP